MTDMPTSPPPEEVCLRLDAVLESRDLAAIWFARPAGFTWLTGGDNRVNRHEAIGVAAAGYDGESVRLVTDSIEAPRFSGEELPSLPVAEFEWYEQSLADAIRERSPRPAAADIEIEGFESIDAATLRQPLHDEAIERYRALGETAASVVEATCRDLEPTMTEREVAGRLRAAFVRRDIDAPVALVGGSERAQSYRHFTPQDVKLGDYAVVSVSVHRDGLYISLTRTVAFDVPPWLAERHEAATRVEASALSATQRVGVEGGTGADVFEAIQAAYAEVGYAGEWRHHHQGGPAGYAAREWLATPTTDRPIALPMAYAWNPTVQGAKSEDTALVTGDDIEVLSTTGDWPQQTADPVGPGEPIDRPAILER